MSGSKYQVALSFAGEQRWYVEEVARNLKDHLKDQDVFVFYDRFEETELWGRNLAEAFHEVFSRAEYVVIFISQDYVSKPWPRYELRSALDRMIQLDREYILPVRFDDTPVPGLHSNISYVRDKHCTPAQLAALIVEWIVEKRSIVDVQGKASDVLLPTVSGTFTVSTGGHGQQEDPSPTDNGIAKPAASETGERAGVETASFGGHGAVTRTDLYAVLQALQRRFPTGQHYTAEDVSKWGLVTAPGGVLRKLDNPSLCRPLLETLHDQKQVTRRANGYRAGQGITWPPSKIMDPKTLDACAVWYALRDFYFDQPEGYTAQEVSEAGLVTDDGRILDDPNQCHEILEGLHRRWKKCPDLGVLKQNGRYSRPPLLWPGGGLPPVQEPGVVHAFLQASLDDGSHLTAPPPKGALELAAEELQTIIAHLESIPPDQAAPARVRAAIEWLKEEIERAQVPDSFRKAMGAARRALWTTPCTASPKSSQEMVSAQQQRVSEDLVARLTPEQKAELTLPQALKGRALDNKEARTTFFNDWCEQHDLPAPDDLVKVFEQQCWAPSEEDCKSLRAAWQVAKWNREKPSP